MSISVPAHWGHVKRLTILAILISAHFSGFAQDENKPKTMDAEAYRVKSRNLRTAGFITVGIGSALVMGGVIWGIHDLDSGTGTFEGPAYMILGGAGVAGASVPLFIASGVNHKRSKQVSLNLQMDRSAPLPMHNMMPAKYPAVAVKWTFR